MTDDTWDDRVLRMVDRLLREGGVDVKHDVPDLYRYQSREAYCDSIADDPDTAWVRIMLRANRPAPVLRALALTGPKALEAMWRLGNWSAVQEEINRLTEIANGNELVGLLDSNRP